MSLLVPVLAMDTLTGGLTS